MHRPDSVQDVVALVRRSRVVDDDRLGRFLELLHDSGLDARRPDRAAAPAAGCQLTPSGVLSLMVERGLLTRYQANELSAGRTGLWVGGYLLLELIGRGGMGQVYLAEHGLLRKRVAVKVLSGGIPADEAIRERFVREARAAAAVDHPNIVRVLDVNAAHDPPFLVMEYVDGVSLQAAVARHGTFSAGETAAVGLQIALGLQTAAAVGLIHRDIKPANVLADRKGGVKILDLGIARFADDPVSGRFDTALILGTLDYLAPEQAENSSTVDCRADLYALGATLYFLLAGHPPYPDDDIALKMARKQATDPPPIASLRPDVPEELSEVIARLLARSPADRHQTPGEVVSALTPWHDPGADFPDRLFLPWRVSGIDSPGQPTASGGEDPSPTPLPPTRSILRSQTERRIPRLLGALPPEPTGCGVTTITATAIGEPSTLPEAETAVQTAPGEAGAPTVTILAKDRAPVRRLWPSWWWIAALGALVLTLLLLLGTALYVIGRS